MVAQQEGPLCPEHVVARDDGQADFPEELDAGCYALLGRAVSTLPIQNGLVAEQCGEEASYGQLDARPCEDLAMDHLLLREGSRDGVLSCSSVDRVSRLRVIGECRALR